MRSVDLKVLNTKLSEYVRLAAAGETVLVTDRDRVVAEIVPPRAERSPILADAMLADMVRKGLLTPPAAPGKVPAPGAEADYESGGAPGGTRPRSKRPVRTDRLNSAGSLLKPVSPLQHEVANLISSSMQRHCSGSRESRKY